MKFLLPHRFKRIGAIICPLGLLLWLFMQTGLLNQILITLFGEFETSTSLYGPYWLVNVIVAIAGFLSFLAGFYFISFSREKVEDERVQRIRLESFQFAALIQIAFFIIGLVLMGIIEDIANDSFLMYFLLLIIFLFWISFIIRFNYIMYFKYRGNEK